MKKLICVIAILCVMLTACAKQSGTKVTATQNENLYKSIIEMLKTQTGFVSASCPNSRQLLNGSVAMTKELIHSIEETLSQYQPKNITQWHVPGDGQELKLFFGDEKALSLQFYKTQKETLIWLQNGQERSQMTTDDLLYDSLNTILSDAVVAAPPLIEGEFVSATLLTGRDIPCGFYEKDGVLAAGYTSFDNKGYVDFYNIANGELIGTLPFSKGILRLDTGFDGSLRVFEEGKLNYIDIKTQKIKSTFEPKDKNLDTGDSFDVHEQLKIYAFIENGVVYVCDLKGKDKNVVMETSSLIRALTADILREIEAKEAFTYFATPRFTKNTLSAIANCNIESYPKVGMSSLELPQDILEKLENNQLEKELMEQFGLSNLPSIFGKLGFLSGYEGDTAIVKCDQGTVFANMLTGEEKLMVTTPQQRVVPIGGGMVIVQTVELPQDGVRNRIDICPIANTEDKLQVLLAKATTLSVEGSSGNTIVIKEGTQGQLLFLTSNKQ